MPFITSSMSATVSGQASRVSDQACTANAARGPSLGRSEVGAAISPRPLLPERSIRKATRLGRFSLGMNSELGLVDDLLDRILGLAGVLSFALSSGGAFDLEVRMPTASPTPCLTAPAPRWPRP